MAAEDEGAKQAPDAGQEPPEDSGAASEPGPSPRARKRDPRKTGARPSTDKLADDDLSAQDRRRQIAELRKARAFAAGAGDAVGGDKHVYYYADGSTRRWLISPAPHSRRDYLRERFVPCPARDQLVGLLRSEHVVFLRGHPRSGRKTAAFAALDLMNGLRVCEISADLKPGDLQRGDVVPGDGYVYDASEAPWAARLTGPALFGCRDVLKQANARLIVLVPPDSRPDSDSVRECLVDHEPVDPCDVLKAHLRADLPGVDIATILAEITECPADVPEAAELAWDLAEEMRTAQPGTCPADIVGKVLRRRPERYRHQAREVLRQAMSGKGSDADLGRRAFIIAWAVLDGLPAVRICQSAQLLAQLLFEVEKAKDDALLGLLPFGEILDGWLSHALEDPRAHGAEIDRQLRYRKGFAAAILKAVWLDYVVAHEPVLVWLELLAADLDWRARLRAASALAQLAVYDFDFIAQHCFAVWSSQKVPALHDATAWALEEVIRQSPQHAERVRGLAEEWSAPEKSIYQHSAAARLLGAVLGALDPQSSIRRLRRIAQQHPQQLSQRVASSVVDIFTYGPKFESLVIAQVSDWARSPQPGMRRLAALTLAELARLDYGDAVPPLMAAFDRAPGQVTELWLGVLCGGMCGPEPWKALLGWSKRGIDLTGLRTRLAREPRLRDPTDFYLGKIGAA